MKGQQTIVNGIPYPSRAAAARATGIRPEYLSAMASKGRLANVGKGKGYRSAVTIAGKTFNSKAAAARALGVDAKDIFGYLRVLASIEGLK